MSGWVVGFCLTIELLTIEKHACQIIDSKFIFDPKKACGMHVRFQDMH